MSENLIGLFFYSFEGGAVYKLQKSKLEETIKPEQKKLFKIIVTGLDRERIKIGADFTPYFVRSWFVLVILLITLLIITNFYSWRSSLTV